MKKSLSLLFLLVVLATKAHAQKSIELFNGKDLRGWAVHGTEKWYAEKGELICESGPDKEYGYLATEKTFKDFELTLEFNHKSNVNTHFFFHHSFPGTKI